MLVKQDTIKHHQPSNFVVNVTPDVSLVQERRQLVPVVILLSIEFHHQTIVFVRRVIMRMLLYHVSFAIIHVKVVQMLKLVRPVKVLHFDKSLHLLIFVYVKTYTLMWQSKHVALAIIAVRLVVHLLQTA